MKKRNFVLLAIGLLVAMTHACTNAATEQPVDTQATVDAAIAATTNAREAAQATIDAAVEATRAAQAEIAASEQPDQANEQAVLEPATEATAPATHTPVPAEVYATMSEEELAALVEDAVAAATTAAEQSATATTDATADDAVTAEELQTVQVYVTGAEEAMVYAEAVLATYESLYGELAIETLEEIQEIEAALEEIAYNTAVINDTLEDIDDVLAQGVELADETIDQLEAAAQSAGVKAGEVQTQTQGWVTDHQAEIDSRVTAAVAMPPSQIAAGDAEALQSATDFFNAAQQFAGDGRVSSAELSELAQKGANASASLDASGIPQLQALSGTIDEITGQFARGDLQSLQTGLTGLSDSLASASSLIRERPGLAEEKPALSGERPSLPEIDAPSGPDRPAPDRSRPGRN